MSEYQVAEKTFPITPEIRNWAEDCSKAIDYLIQNPGDPAHHIRPITIQLNDGNGGKFTQQCGMSFGDKGENGQEVNFIVATHTNELTALRLVELAKTHYLQHEEAFKGKQINLIFGGDPERARELLAHLKDPNRTEMTEGEYETYRNTAHQVNCNRVDSSNIPRAPAGDKKGMEAWNKAFDKLRFGKSPEVTSSEEAKWHQLLKNYYDSLDSEQGSPGWLLQKHFALQKYRDRIDFHTMSRTGATIAYKCEMAGTALDEKSLRLFARMQAAYIICPPCEGKYLHMQSSLSAEEKDGMVFECGAHRDIEKSALAAENGFYGAVLDRLGVDLAPERAPPQSVTMTFCEGMKLVFPPLSPTASDVPDGALNLIPEFYLDGKNIPANDPQVTEGHWGCSDERKSRFHTISTHDPLPRALQRILRHEKISTHDNGDSVIKGAPLFWATYTLPNGTVIPVLFRSPVNGVTFMTPAKGWDAIDGRFSFSEISTHGRKITIRLQDDTVR